MPESKSLFNPFPGLRPFESSETHLFFGRDGQSDELLRRLRQSRFIAVVGTSGSGKSSLVRAGLLPSLHGGLMTKAGSNWRVALFRPGEDPIGHMAEVLNDPAVLGSGEEADLQKAIIETTLRRSALGLVDAARQARMPRQDNLLVVVDQFEEIFRFKQLRKSKDSDDEAAAFVKLLLEAARQDDVSIYVVLTMRSDYLGDCAQFRDLPEAINNSQYLIPRMSRDQRREAITGPIAVGGGEITPRLVNRLLNDVGDNPDQLPILQHALMRTWDYWAQNHKGREPIDVQHYEAIGGMTEALSRHADEAYNELADAHSQQIAEKLFKSLTEKEADNREIRRPTKVAIISAVTEASEDDVIRIIECFRRPGRSFLMPPTNLPLHSESLIDISHESLIRNWRRLKQWVNEEARSAQFYRRLGETSVLYKEGRAGLWRDPDLHLALEWREQSRPTKAWAERYHPEFDGAMTFLDRSKAAHDAEIAEKERQRKAELQRTRRFAAILGLAFVIALVLGLYAYHQQRKAIAETKRAESARKEAEEKRQMAQKKEQEAEEARHLAEEQKQRALKNEQEAKSAQTLAEENFQLAVKNSQGIGSVADELKSLGTQFKTVKKILDITESSYEKLLAKAPQSALVLENKARMRNSFVDLYLKLGDTGRASSSANEALKIFKDLVHQDPSRLAWQNGLGLSLALMASVQLQQGHSMTALSSLRESLVIRKRLVKKDPENPEFWANLADAQMSIGQVLWVQGDWTGAKAAYEDAVPIFERLVQRYPKEPKWQLKLALGYLRKGNTLSWEGNKVEALKKYQNALDIVNRLVKRDPGNAYWQTALCDANMEVGNVLNDVQVRDQLKRVGDLDRPREHVQEKDVDQQQLESYQACLAVADRFTNVDPENPEWQRRVLLSRYNIEELQGKKQISQKPEAMRSAWQKSFDNQRALGDELQKLAKQRMEHDRADAQWEFLLASSHLQVAMASINLAQSGVSPKENFSKAEASLNAAQSVYDGLVRKDPDNYAWSTGLSLTYSWRGNMLRAQGDTKGMQNAYIKSVRIKLASDERRAQRDPGNISWQQEVARDYYQLGLNLAVSKDRAALAAYQKSLALYERLLQKHPEHISWLDGLAETYEGIGRFFGAQGEFPNASGPLQQAVTIRERLVQLEPNNLARLRAFVSSSKTLAGTFMYHLGKYKAESEAIFKRIHVPQARVFMDDLAHIKKLYSLPTDSSKARTWPRWGAALEGITASKSVQQNRELLGQYELMYTLSQSPLPALDIVEACLDLAKNLAADSKFTEKEKTEVRQLLEQSLKIYQELGQKTKLAKEEEELIEAFKDALKTFPMAKK